MKMAQLSILFYTAVWCLVAQTQVLISSAFQTSLPVVVSRTSVSPSPASNIKLHLLPEIHNSLIDITASSTSIILSEDGGESWRQYVPLVVAVGVIIDILLGSPLANLALGPMKRASEKGATGDDGEESGGSMLFPFGDKKSVVDTSKERVDSDAIAQATLTKAMYTLELRNFLDENKTDEQKYEDVRKKIDRQMDELEDL